VDVGVVEVRGEVADGDGGPEARLDLPLQRPRHHPGPGGGEGIPWPWSQTPTWITVRGRRGRYVATS